MKKIFVVMIVLGMGMALSSCADQIGRASCRERV